MKTNSSVTIVTVGPHGQYPTINAALSAISPTAANPYIVAVEAGTYTESVSLPSYVTLSGEGETATLVTYSANDENSTISINPLDEQSCQNIAIQNLTVERIGGIAYSDQESPTAAIFIQSSSQINVSNVTCIASYPATNAQAIPMGIYVTGDGTLGVMCSQVTIQAMGNAGALIGVVVTEVDVAPPTYPVILSGCKISISSAVAQKCIGVGAIVSGTVQITGTSAIFPTTIAVTATAAGANAIAVMASASGFQGGPVDSYVDLTYATLTGDVIGHFITHKGVLTPSGAPYPFNENVVTVGQDLEQIVGMLPLNGRADFGSITGALNWVSGKASAESPYVIKVFPGTYIEHVAMLSYVDIVGSGREVTQISYTGAHNYNVMAATSSSLNHLTLTTLGASANAMLLHAHQVMDFEVRDCWLETTFNQFGPGYALGIQASDGADIRLVDSAIFSTSSEAVGINVIGNSLVEVRNSIVDALGVNDGIPAPPVAAIITADTSIVTVVGSQIEASDTTKYTTALINNGTDSNPQIFLAMSQISGGAQGSVQTSFCVDGNFAPYMGLSREEVGSGNGARVHAPPGRAGMMRKRGARHD